MANQGTLICRRTGNLRAVELLLGLTKIESTVRYLGIKIDDVIEFAAKPTFELSGQCDRALPYLCGGEPVLCRADLD